MAYLDPLALARETAEVVSRGDERKYYRFRAARFYGGIATADCVGCNLRCLFCWAWEVTTRPAEVGEFLSARQVADRLVSLARRKGLQRVRLSGNEPTLAREHLLALLRLLPEDLLFILETNGLLIGADPSYALELARRPNLYVRVSLKGASEADFARLTQANPEGFGLQLAALRNLIEAGVDCFPAVMTSFSSAADIAALRRRMAEIRPDFADFEPEEVVLYGSVAERLRRAGLPLTCAHDPRRVPPEQV
jgi:uncharacterized Fe-S cluster-containing radical SAM superfamily protein